MDQQLNSRLLSNLRTLTVSRHWLPFAIATTAILASTIISFWGSSRILILILALIGGTVGTVALLRQPNLGLILILGAGMFVPFSGPGGLNAVIITVGIMLGLWLMEMFVVQRNFQFVHSASLVPIVTFLVISTLAFVVGQIPWFVFARQAPITAQVGGYAVFLLSIGCLLLSAHLIKDIRWLKIIVWVFIGLSAFYVIGRTFDLSFVVQLYHSRFTAQSMFWTWLITLAASQVIFNSRLPWHMKGLLTALVLLTFYVATIQSYDWKSGWIPPLIATLVLLGIRYRKLVLIAIPVIMLGTLYATMNLIASDEYSWGTRLDAWRIVLEISRVSPIFGTGFANYYWYTPLFPIRGWYVSFNSHSQFIDLIAQTGFLGLLAFCWLFIVLGQLSWRLSNYLPDGFARAYTYGVFAGIVATVAAAFLGDWVLPFVYNVGLNGFRASILPWMFMGGVIALEQILHRNRQATFSRSKERT